MRFWLGSTCVKMAKLAAASPPSSCALRSWILYASGREGYVSLWHVQHSRIYVLLHQELKTPGQCMAATCSELPQTKGSKGRHTEHLQHAEQCSSLPNFRAKDASRKTENKPRRGIFFALTKPPPLPLLRNTHCSDMELKRESP